MFKTIFVALAFLTLASGVHAQYGSNERTLPSITDPDQASEDCYVAPEWRSET
jgi:hypothetical protein